MSNRSLVGLVASMAVMVAGCATAYKPVTGIPQITSNAKMKVYSANSSMAIAQTNPKDDAQQKQYVFTQTFLPGINVQTAVLNAENTFGIRLTRSYNMGFYDYNGHIGNRNDATVTYTVQWKSPNEVLFVDCFIQGPIQSLSLSELKSIATDYLGFVATLPYRGSKPELAKKWVVSTIQSTHFPRKYAITHKIGKANFYLFPYTVIPGTSNSPKELHAELDISTDSY
jgi:hypothetical protein